MEISDCRRSLSSSLLSFMVVGVVYGVKAALLSMLLSPSVDVRTRRLNAMRVGCSSWLMSVGSTSIYIYVCVSYINILNVYLSIIIINHSVSVDYGDDFDNKRGAHI